MTALSWVALAVAAVAAGTDWWSVARGDKRVEYVAKPLAMLALLVVAASIDVAEYHGPQPWFVGALALSLVGDVFLMLPKDRFIPGLVAFLVAHVAYVLGFVVAGVAFDGALLVGVVLVGTVVVLLSRRILAGLRTSGQSDLAIPVSVYMAVIAAMAISATGAGPVLA
ncbi:MAG: putative rane protein, partial [Actinomycetia bacterium]|nr:putative rane protein [Actinomycetes bacterium]